MLLTGMMKNLRYSIGKSAIWFGKKNIGANQVSMKLLGYYYE